MSITSIYAVVPSSDLERSRTWWATILGREPDRIPMPSDIEWIIEGGSGLQLIDDAERAGAGQVTLGVDDVDAVLATIAAGGVDVPEATTVPSGEFRIATLTDPDGNQLTLAGSIEA